MAAVTAACGMKPISVDPELEVLHGPDGTLQFIMSKHVDDLKSAGIPEAEKRVMDHIQSVFGPLRIVRYKFTNCCVRHTQNASTNCENG